MEGIGIGTCLCCDLIFMIAFMVAVEIIFDKRWMP